MEDIIGNQQERLFSAEYVAGFFDGEGSVSLIASRAPRGRSLRPEITIAQKDKRTIDALVASLNALGVGCHVSFHAHRSGIYRIMVSGMKRAKAFIEVIGPHTYLKADELKLLYSFIERRLALPPATPYAPCDDAVRAGLVQIRLNRSAESSEANMQNAA